MVPNWTKVENYSQDGCNQARGLSQNRPHHSNWVRGATGYWNLDKFLSLRVDTNWNPCYDDSSNPQEWAVVGKTDSGQELFLKSYKKKENAYSWLAGVMGGN